MREINRLQESITDFESEMRSDVGSQLQTFVENGDLPYLVAFANRVETIQAERGDNEIIDMLPERLYQSHGSASAISDVAEQLEIANNDRQNGTSSQTVAKRLTHAINACSAAIEQIEVVENVTAAVQNSGEQQVGNTTDIRASARDAKNELRQIRRALDESVAVLE